jgi:hypothetical protein
MAIGTFTTLNLTVGLPVPKITLTGSTLTANTVIDLYLPNIVLPIKGKFISGQFVPDNFGTPTAQIVPSGTLTGYRNITLSSVAQTSYTQYSMILQGVVPECPEESGLQPLPTSAKKCSQCDFDKLKLCLVGKTITISPSGVITNII